MKNKKSLNRLEKMYALFMVLGVFLCIAVLFLSNAFVGADPEVTQTAEIEKSEDEKAALMKDTVMGDVYDRNGVLLVATDAETGNMQYKHDEAYTNTIGFFIRKKGAMLLMENFHEDLFYSNGDTNKGRNLFLTLDAKIQEEAHQLINSGFEERGSITVLDAKTGAVIAMAFNPSISIQEIMDYCAGNVEVGTWRNNVLDGNNALIEPLSAPKRPGSIFKILTSIGILEMNLENKVIRDEGTWEDEAHGVKIENSNKAAYGDLTYYRAFVKSSNLYFGRMAYESLGWDAFTEIAKRCKVGETQKYDFGVVHSTYISELTKPEERYTLNALAKTGYGYADIQLTGVHAAMITQGIANGGVMCSPYMLDRIYETTGYEIEDGKYRYRLGKEVSSISSYSYQKGEEIQITTKEAAQKITEAMLGVYEDKQGKSNLEGVESGGLVVNGVKYPIALKTGTADLSDDLKDYNNTWMVSFAPADDPQYVVVVNRYGVTEGYGAGLFDDVMKMYQLLFGN